MTSFFYFFLIAKEFGCTECLNPKDYDKPIQQVKEQITTFFSITIISIAIIVIIVIVNIVVFSLLKSQAYRVNHKCSSIEWLI